MNVVSLAQPFEAQFKFFREDSSIGWADCQVVGVKTDGFTQSLIVITQGENGMIGGFEVAEVRPMPISAIPDGK
ncbi:hypothetical protein BMJ27_07475 [Sinorhizobium medicae]|uniref:hypothetical protein n=1 Tax=Sinorhizobium medicae TaxID=110321 RepID=UPI000C7A5268|nr:hypothetical protein [Sinorhizobium medicae]PLU37993.1 hypothetical protein BMJ27_07475 [Sinorhizobium medicae]